MKAKFLLTATLLLALFVGSANASPIKHEGYKTNAEQNVNKNTSYGNNQEKHYHHRHHKKHHYHHMMHH